MMQTRTFTLTCALLISVPAAAETYAYRSIGAQGEVSFSDIPSDTATSIELEESASPGPSSAQQVQLMLTVAKELAEARIAREAARQAKREQAAKARRERAEAYRLERLQNSTQVASQAYPIWFPPAFHGHATPHPAHPHPAHPRRGHRYGVHPQARRAAETAPGSQPPRSPKSARFRLPE